MEPISNLFRKFFFKTLLGKSFSKKLLDNIFYFSDVSKDFYLSNQLLKLSLQEIGIGYFPERVAVDEAWFINNFLKKEFANREKVCLFDVGANRGQFLKHLIAAFSHSEIYSFEPNLECFKILKNSVRNIPNVKCLNFGLGNISGEFPIYLPKKDLLSERATLLPNAINFLKANEQVLTQSIQVKTLDIFCEENNIQFIDFLKIDTEGYEFNVLLGASRLINEKRINIIQFEFNEMNVEARVFLKDFYDLLKDFRFYRLGPESLIYLGEYSSKNEIFVYQNIVAIRK